MMRDHGIEHMRKSVLALGLDPIFADFTEFPELTPNLIRTFIDSQLGGLGYEVDSCVSILAKAPKPSSQSISNREASIAS
jgi:hypothetical protein